jgi:hypothetical protein
VKNVAFLLTLALGVAAMAQPYEGLVGASGRIQLDRNGRPAFTISTGAFADGWRGATLAPAKLEAGEDGVCRGKINLPGDLTIASALAAKTVGGVVELRYTLTPQADAKLNSLHVSLGMPTAFLKGASYTIEGETKEIPAVLGATHLRSGDHVPNVRFTWPNGDWLQVDILSKTPVLLQDNRQWGESFDLRLGPQMVPAQTLPAKQPVEIALRLTAKDGLKATTGCRWMCSWTSNPVRRWTSPAWANSTRPPASMAGCRRRRMASSPSPTVWTHPAASTV